MMDESARKTPKGWRLIALNEATRHHSGNSNLIKGKLVDRPEEGLFPAFSATGQDVWRDDFEQEGSAIIVSAVGARCGKCFRADGKWSAIANTHIVWAIEEVIDRDFLWFNINDENYWIKGGSAQPFVKIRESFQRKFLLPPLAEQKKIASILNSVNDVIENTQKQLDKFRDLKKSLTRDLLIGKVRVKVN